MVLICVLIYPSLHLETVQQYFFNLDVIKIDSPTFIPGIVLKGAIYHLAIQIIAGIVGGVFARGFIRGRLAKKTLIKTFHNLH